MLYTQPDVSYGLSMTSGFQSYPGECHWIAVKNMLKYLRRTKDIFLIYGGQEGELVINGYTNAGFQSKLDDFRSQSNVLFEWRCCELEKFQARHRGRFYYRG